MKTFRCLMILMVVLTMLGLGSMTAQTVYAAGEWYAEYYNNAQLAGNPQLTRYESALTLNWGRESPGAGIPYDNFSARLTRDVWFAGGTYRFSYRSDDGLRLWVDDTLVIDSWHEQAAPWLEVDHYVAAGTHQVRVEYYEVAGFALLQIGWEKVQAGATWHAGYYSNVDLGGDPVFSRSDAAIDFDWGSGSPDAAVPADRFSARWHRTLGFEAGNYRFYASADDGVRLFVDGQLILNAWVKQKLPNTHQADITLTRGQHTVVVEYFEEGGEAAVHIWWSRLDTAQNWQGRYFDNRDFRGGPTLIRNDAEINFDWGEGGPASWMPDDNFSVQWIQTVSLTPGLYRFNARADDGVRLWIDDIDLRLNHWESQDYVWHYQDWHYLEGVHTLRVEYFEQNGLARIQFWWDYAASAQIAQSTPPSPIYKAPAQIHKPLPAGPAGQPAVAPLPGPWTAEYFNSRDLTKAPVLVRTDAEINYDWGWESPAPGVPANQFAVRWTGTFDFPKGTYRFSSTTDDGVRVYVDDLLILNSWWPMRGNRYATVSLTAGAHAVKVEYFEAMQAAKARVTWTRTGN
ncbi:MAG: PA14 domain-containing protein [Anaerolineae bacterium]|nr:PA14 domain-containing protein [Anaerolineae bacterium]